MLARETCCARAQFSPAAPCEVEAGVLQCLKPSPTHCQNGTGPDSLRFVSFPPIGDTGVLGLSTSVNDVQPAKATSLRRSQRVCLNVDIEIRLEHAGAKATSELTKTLIVNAHGALILLQSRVSTGDLLRMKNLKTLEEMLCRVVDSTSGTTGVPEVGVEFVKPALNFWHIAFPPADWSPRGPESKIYGPQVVASLAKGTKP